MARLLITQSLLSAWGYAHTCFETCAEDAYQDFLDTLNRVPKEATPEMQNGIDFENLVYSIASGKYSPKFEFEGTAHPFGDTEIMGHYKYPKWYRGAKAVATIIKGAPVQVKVQGELSIGEHTIVVYGILDALKAGTIYDVKFSNKGFGSADLAGKYLESPQHPAYLFMVPEAREFQYLVSDGEDLYTETYTRKNTRPFRDIVVEFLNSIEAMGLMPVYLEKWQAR